MMKTTSQSGQIADRIMQLMANGMTDKSEIMTKVVEEMGVPRPTVRRVKKDLVETLRSHVKVLS